MSEDDQPRSSTTALRLAEPSRSGGDEPPRGRPRVRKRRLFVVLLPLGLLALVSAVFGMIMAIASDLPALENQAQFRTAKNSVMTDINGRPLGVLTDRNNRILITSGQIPLVMKRSIIAIEDRRFYSNAGIDVQGIGRAFIQDIFKQRAVQGASTITQQFVKNALQAQNRRTILQKLREAALAFHLTKKWSKDKILTEYLNSIYFGNGAYGLESAARTYFGHDPTTDEYGCETPGGPPLCVTQLNKPWEAALLAGIVASPSAYDPVSHPVAARARRNLVLNAMRQQGYLTPAEYQDAITKALPPREYVQPPKEQAINPQVAYFTTWVRQQVVDHYTARQAFEGGLRIRTTIDLDLQEAAQRAINNFLADPSGPTAALVAIDNQSGEVRALVGGRNYNDSAFNLATQGQRQPGSAFKPFVLAQALREGISPDSVWPSRRRVFTVPNTHRREHFVVRNYEGSYAGSRTLQDATVASDNSVFAAVGIRTGVARIAELAQRMGIRTPVSHNYAISLGGLREGVTPLDMAHAYETLARGGLRTYGSLGTLDAGPVGIHSVLVPGRSLPDVNHVAVRRVLPTSLVNLENGILHQVVTDGTAKRANPGEWAAGKTGTTENYGDAWFVGFTHRYTVAVWVGYPTGTRSMKTDYAGSPVAGGTFPALIWHDFVVAADEILKTRATKNGSSGAGTQSAGSSGSQTNTSSSSAGAAAGRRQSGRGASGGGAPTPRRAAAPSPGRAPAPAPAPAAPPSAPGASPPPAAQGGGAQAPSG